jgi:hypothetical protein
MRGYFEFDSKVLAESNALANGAAKRPAPRSYPDVDLGDGAEFAAEVDSLLAGYGVGKGDRLVIADRGGAVECETLTPWYEQ